MQIAGGPLGDGLAQPRRPHQGQRSGLGNEGGIEGAQDELALEVGAEAEVELLDARREGEAGLPQATLDQRLRAGGGFLLKEPLEEVGIGQFLAGSTVEPGGQHGRGVGQADLVEQWPERTSSTNGRRDRCWLGRGVVVRRQA
jgi:hypothetical protein